MALNIEISKKGASQEMLTGFLSEIPNYLSDIFGIVGSAFNGVYEVFWDTTTQTPTLLLQILGLVAAATLVSAAIYVVVRLIKGVMARIRGGVTSAK